MTGNTWHGAKSTPRGLVAELPFTGRKESITNMEKFEMNGYRGSALPFFLTGLGTGIALALLLAPRSGAATRGLIGRKVNEGEDWIKDTAAATEDYVLSQAAGLRDRVNEVAEVIGRSTARTAGAKILERQEI